MSQENLQDLDESLEMPAFDVLSKNELVTEFKNERLRSTTLEKDLFKKTA